MTERQVDVEPILQLIGLIYDSAAEWSRWPVFLGAFVRAVGGRQGSLALLAERTKESGMVCWSGWPDEYIRLYRRYAAIDPWRIGSARWPEGAVGTDADLRSREEMASSAAFREFYAPNGAIHGMGGTILVTVSGRSMITATRQAGDGPFGEPEKAILRPLMPHLKRAAILQRELGSLQSQLAMFADHLDRYSHAFVLVDAQAGVLYANTAAFEIGGRRDGLTLGNGRLTITSPAQDAAVLQSLAEISAGHGIPLRRFLISRPSRKDPYRLILMPAKNSGAIPLGFSMPAVSILIIDPALRAEPDVPFLCELFSLTPAEGKIAAKLALGRNVEEIAAELAISIETVRTHIKRILSKTGTERQGGLISLILRSVPVRQTISEFL